MQEQFGYGYDAAWNLSSRTNYAEVQAFGVNDLNELTNSTASGLTHPVIAGATTAPATSVTVNSSTANLYGDATFATTNRWQGLGPKFNPVLQQLDRIPRFPAGIAAAAGAAASQVPNSPCQ